LEERNIIVCMPVEGATIKPVTDSVQLHCLGCGEMVWVAPSSVRLVMQKDADPMCTGCVLKHMQVMLNNPDYEFGFDIAPGALEELEEYERENGL
jgi:hypothetical protein